MIMTFSYWMADRCGSSLKMTKTYIWSLKLSYLIISYFIYLISSYLLHHIFPSQASRATSATNTSTATAGVFCDVNVIKQEHNIKCDQTFLNLVETSSTVEIWYNIVQHWLNWLNQTLFSKIMINLPFVSETVLIKYLGIQLSFSIHIWNGAQNQYIYVYLKLCRTLQIEFWIFCFHTSWANQPSKYAKYI